MSSETSCLWALFLYFCCLMKTMKIEDLIPDSSKLAAMDAAGYLVKNPSQIKEALKLVFKDEYPLSMRAANVIEVCSEARPDLVKPYIDEIIQRLPSFKTDGVKRCFLKMISMYDLPDDEEKLSILLNCCFEWIMSAEETVAVKVFSLEILYNITQKESDLKQELISVIEDQIPKNSIAFQNRGMKTLKKLYKETDKR